MRNWAERLNFEVETGPLAIRVRRWGFPHSPLHPIFTPGRMDVIQAVDIEAMRDDEWVLLGDEQLYTADANIVDLGLVYNVRWQHGTAQIVMTMPHRGRPVHDFFVSRGGGRVEKGIRERLLEIDGVRDVVVDLTWTPARLTDTGRRALGLA